MHGNHEKLQLLAELKDFLAQKGGEEMQGMSMDEDEDSDMGPPMGDEKPALAIEIEAPAKPPGPPGGGDDIDSLIAQGMASSDPTVKKMAEALMKSKKPGGM